VNVQQRVRQFVLENFYVADPAELRDETSLVESGTVDSTGILELIGFLETEYGIRVSDVDTTPENLGSIARIAAFVERQRSASARVPA
jgi:acyl carrier protein